jgi:hypothetical protein
MNRQNNIISSINVLNLKVNAQQVSKFKLAKTLQEFEKKGIYHAPKSK